MAAFETEAMVEIDSAIRSVILVTVSLDLTAVLLMVIQVINAEKGASEATSSKVVPSAIAIDTIVALMVELDLQLRGRLRGIFDDSGGFLTRESRTNKKAFLSSKSSQD